MPRSTKNRQPRREMVPRIWACAMRLPSTPTIDGDKSDNREEARPTVTSEESEGAPLLRLRGPGASDPVFPSHFPAGGWNLRRTKQPWSVGEGERRQERWSSERASLPLPRGAQSSGRYVGPTFQWNEAIRARPTERRTGSVGFASHEPGLKP